MGKGGRGRGGGRGEGEEAGKGQTRAFFVLEPRYSPISLYQICNWGDCSVGFCSNLVIVERRRRFWMLYVDGRDVPRAKCPMKMQYTRLLLSARSSA